MCKISSIGIFKNAIGFHGNLKILGQTTLFNISSLILEVETHNWYQIEAQAELVMITLYDDLESRSRSQDSRSIVVKWAKIRL